MTRLGSIILLGALLGGCATNITKHMEPAELKRGRYRSARDATPTIDENLRVKTARGLRVRVPGGADWVSAGTIAQGTVFKSKGPVVTLGSGHSYEAYLVTAGGVLQGFYLPSESGFIECKKPVPLQEGGDR